MDLTSEQRAITDSGGDIRINAVAGSGKTTTLIEYARTRPRGSRILYIAFNRSVRIEARRKFDAAGLAHADVETAHSLAYRHTHGIRQGKVREGYRVHEVAALLGLSTNGDRHAEYVLADHINRFATYFCNSDARRVPELNYLDIVSGDAARQLVERNYAAIEANTRSFLAMMDRGDIGMIHDFYLKKFQLAMPRLPYDHILFDEGQDASAAMLDIFLRQDAVKVIVGDVHQQIYGWRHAVNAMDAAGFPTLPLNVSFRFPQAIAGLAMDKLRMKKHLGDSFHTGIVGLGRHRELSSEAVIARTNVGLLEKAIDHVRKSKKDSRIYFEGNINSYTYADEGASIYDILSLSNGRREGIRDKLLASMRDMEDLREYVELTEDRQLGMMADMVDEYGNEIPELIRSIKDRHIGDDDKTQADMIFTTVHRCKGMEYDMVRLADDFITEDSLLRQLEKDRQPASIRRLSEEVNLLYVAVTRTRNKLIIPSSVASPASDPSPHIIVLTDTRRSNRSGTPYSRSGSQPKPRAADRKWTDSEDRQLTHMYEEGKTLKDMVLHFERSASAIQMRIRKLNLS
jgi:hypothetical protein